MGWGDCFLGVMSYFLNNSILITHYLKIASLALFQNKCGFTSKTIWQSYVDAIVKPERHNKDIITKAEKHSMEIHNVMSNTEGGWVVLNL